MSDALDPYWSRVRDGERVALAALCSRWGRPVFAYCEHVAGPGQGIVATSRAFAQFRAAAASLVGAGPGDAEANLRRIARRAAIALDGKPDAASEEDVDGPRCPGRRAELIALVEESLSAPAFRMLDEHVVECRACSAVLRRLEAGERAFERPPRVPLPPRVVEEIVLAMVYAAPLRPRSADPHAVRGAVLRLLELTSAPNASGTAGAPPVAAAPVQSPVADEPVRAPVAGRPLVGSQLRLPQIAKPRRRPGHDRKPRRTRAEPRPEDAGERSRGSSFVVTVVAIVASSGGMMIINSWSADDTARYLSPPTTPGAEREIQRTATPRPRQPVSGAKGVGRTATGSGSVTRLGGSRVPRDAGGTTAARRYGEEGSAAVGRPLPVTPRSSITPPPPAFAPPAAPAPSASQGGEFGGVGET